MGIFKILRVLGGVALCVYAIYTTTRIVSPDIFAMPAQAPFDDPFNSTRWVKWTENWNQEQFDQALSITQWNVIAAAYISFFFGVKMAPVMTGEVKLYKVAWISALTLVCFVAIAEIVIKLTGFDPLEHFGLPHTAAVAIRSTALVALIILFGLAARASYKEARMNKDD